MKDQNSDAAMKAAAKGLLAQLQGIDLSEAQVLHIAIQLGGEDKPQPKPVKGEQTPDEAEEEAHCEECDQPKGECSCEG